ncbi:winged helix-turn-helix domain-containing protein [Mycolicibacterium neoaurum]|uniref:MarR family transcriptional regulator n=1 Tax=Mycolicibacterium neoaurum TaxID=1795 RepID=A0AAV2WI99_MYCNE|nr:winged helix-turn-helix domain-containing protein [Mycolicibacterium neoaurum]TLH63360.1 ArsR family transcriptional regulator [Mycolicibacterium neoaurum]CDQ43974.1 hypothetical protein BN1047_01846 [Mycolicibacterium neoaurum]
MAPQNSGDERDRFAEAIQSLKLYRRAELESAQGEDLIEKLYVDPLPQDHVHKLLRQPNTTFLIGRKGTGKSTVFLRAQKSLLAEKNVLSTYVDIKTVYESAQVDPETAKKIAQSEDALPENALQQLLLMTAFIRAVVEGVRDDLKKQLQASWKLRVREAFTGGYEGLFNNLDNFIHTLETPQFIDVQGIRKASVKSRALDRSSGGMGAGLKVDAASLPEAHLDVSATNDSESESEFLYSELLLRTIDIRSLVKSFKKLLEPLGAKHLYVFLDDFSELPISAMQTVVDGLIAPLNNWSEELVKFKIAAYPGRIYYGSLDKSKIDEVSLDLYNLYGQHSVSEMEAKGVDFVRRLVDRRLEFFGLRADDFITSRRPEAVWTALFQASLGNPRTLGYILYFAYENQILYGRKINITSVKDAAKRYYEEKIEPYFNMGAFLHEAFEEKSTIFSLKELLEKIVDRARHLRSKHAANIFQAIQGQHPTSHFNLSPIFDSILSTLELNFFVTKYYIMSNRDGNRVSVYALNYGLCEKYTIAFGRPVENREDRLYFVERVFDYNAILQDYMVSNQEIRCDNCSHIFDPSELDALKRFKMLCPECRAGRCVVTNISRKYESVIRAVNAEQLLPATELGILQTLSVESEPLRAGDIAGELDVSYQLVGKRAKKLSEQDLVDRRMNGGRRQFKISESARRIYFDPARNTDLELSQDND